MENHNLHSLLVCFSICVESGHSASHLCRRKVKYLYILCISFTDKDLYNLYADLSSENLFEYTDNGGDNNNNCDKTDGYIIEKTKPNTPLNKRYDL